jgi:hypothetical protein
MQVCLDRFNKVAMQKPHKAIAGVGLGLNHLRVVAICGPLKK